MKPAESTEQQTQDGDFSKAGRPAWSSSLWTVLIFLMGMGLGCYIGRVTIGEDKSCPEQPYASSNNRNEAALVQEDVALLPWWENFDTANTLRIRPCATSVASVLQTVASAFALASRERVNIKFVESGLWFNAENWGLLFAEPAIGVGDVFPNGITEPSHMLSCSDPSFTNEMWSSASDHEDESWMLPEQNCIYECDHIDPPVTQDTSKLFQSLRLSHYMSNNIQSYKESVNWDQYFMIGVYFGEPEGQGAAKWPKNWESYVKQIKKLEQRLSGTTEKPIRFFLVSDDPHSSRLIAGSFDEGHVLERMRFSAFDHDDVSATISVANLYLLAACDEIIATESSVFTDTVYALKKSA